MNAQVKYLMGLTAEYIHKGNLDDADRLLKQSLKIDPKNSEALRLSGIILAFKKMLPEALKLFDQSIKADSRNWLSHSNRGNVLRSFHQLDEALKSYNKAIALQPSYSEVYNNKGNVLLDLNRLEESIASYDKAIGLNPTYADAYHGMGNALKKIGNLLEALESYEAAARLNPLAAHMTSSCISTKMEMCSWNGLQDEINHLLHSALNSNTKIHPFYLLSICNDPAFLMKVTKLYILDNFSVKNDIGVIKRSKKLDRIRIAYFSADFRNHPVSLLTTELYEIHDRSRFEVFAFSLHRAPEDDVINSRLRKGFDRFIDAENMSDLEIARLARELEIDIAIDLCGQTQFAKTGIFSYRAAPIQVNWLGYPGTSGADFIDYIVGDKTVIPESHQQFYTEKVVHLPDTYMVDDSMRIPSPRVFTREECGLPNDDFVFCCFNNSYKFNPQVLDGWSRILLKVENSVLWISENNKYFKSNIVIEFEKRGINSKRIIFAQRIELMADHLARAGLADIFLDTYPYNAHTTTMDSLKAGVPVLTLMGQSFTSRVAASLLNAIDLPELITTTQSEYEAKAIEFALNPQKLAVIKQRLASNRLTTPLFNTQRFTKNLEAAYLKMYERYQAGSQPEPLFIEASTL